MPTDALVLDASVAVSWCFPDEDSGISRRAFQLVTQGSAIVAAHWPYEVTNSLVMNVRRKRLTREAAQDFSSMLQQLAIRVEAHSLGDMDAVVSLADQHELTVYDAAYLDLAIRQHLPLATLDKALLRAAARCSVPTILPL